MKFKYCNEDIFQEAVKTRRYIHQNPELSTLEFETQKYIAHKLDNLGLNYEMVSTGIIGKITTKGATKTIGLRADIDALPIKEATTLAFKSLNHGVMHACGHDVHTAILLGTLEALLKIPDKLKVNVVFIFQPDEEKTCGARLFLDHHYFLEIDQIFALHVAPDVTCGHIGYQFGQMSATSDVLEVDVIGKATHAGYPHFGIDPVIASANIILNLQQIVSRMTDPLASTVISVGTINGGTAANVIPDKVSFTVSVRNLDVKASQAVIDRTKDVITKTASINGCVVTIKQNIGYPSLINTDKSVNFGVTTLQQMHDLVNIFEIKTPAMGGEDFAYYLTKKPGAFFILGSGFADTKNAPLHNPHFEVDENCIKYAIEFMAANCINFYNT